MREVGEGGDLEWGIVTDERTKVEVVGKLARNRGGAVSLLGSLHWGRRNTVPFVLRPNCLT